jgi:ABC-type transport system substrate-binding protein
MTIMENTWRRAGIDVRPQVINATQLRDQQLRASFPTMYSTSAGGGERGQLGQFASSEIPRPENRWAGSNRGGWVNPEYDQLWNAFNQTLERPQRDQQAIQMMKIVSDNLPAFMSFFNYYVNAHTSDLVGPDPTGYDTLVFWNMHEWELR